MWRRSENGSLDKPPEIDTTSSQKVVYVRKNYEQIEASGDTPAHWRWEETKVPKEDWEVYEKILGHDSALDDVYAALTELAELITEG